MHEKKEAFDTIEHWGGENEDTFAQKRSHNFF